MLNIFKVTKASAIFLAIVLVAGTFAAISPFIIGVNAQSEPYYGMDDRYSDYKQDYEMNSYDKKTYGNSYEQEYSLYGKDRDYDNSKDSSSSVSIKKIKCNNINANLNSVDASFGVPPVDGDTDGAGGPDGAVSAESIAANGMGGNGDRSFVDRENNFAFVCINNNNNTVIEGETPAPPVEECPEADEIESCFRQFLGSGEEFAILTEVLENGLDVVIEGEPVTLNSFADICLALEGLTFEQLRPAIVEIIVGAGINTLNLNLVTCIAEALDIPITPP